MDIDITRYLGTITRDVELRQHEGKPAQVVTVSRTYDTDIEDAWDALTNPERIPRWFAPVDGDLRPGGRFQIEGNASGDITRCEPPTDLALTWEFADNTSWVTLTLTQRDDGQTRLVLQHIAHTPDDFWNQYGPGATGVGWDLSFVGLGEHLAGAPPIDHELAAQWPTTEQGRAFVADASQAWGRASIAAGTDPSAARSAAANTRAFYTGQPQPTDRD